MLSATLKGQRLPDVEKCWTPFFETYLCYFLIYIDAINAILWFIVFHYPLIFVFICVVPRHGEAIGGGGGGEGIEMLWQKAVSACTVKAERRIYMWSQGKTPYVCRYGILPWQWAPIDHIHVRQTSTLYKSMTGGLLSQILFWQDEEFY